MSNIKRPDILEHFIEFLIERVPPEDILNFKASEVIQQRADELTELNKLGQINRDERAELERMIAINSMISVLKARAMRMQKERGY